MDKVCGFVIVPAGEETGEGGQFFAALSPLASARAKSRPYCNSSEDFWPAPNLSRGPIRLGLDRMLAVFSPGSRVRTGCGIMNYHLNRDGQDLGIFSTEALAQRRASGELSGRELVWAPGMERWQLLDVMLGRGLPANTAAAASADSNKAQVVAWIIIGAVLLTSVVWFSFLWHKMPVGQALFTATEANSESAMQAATAPVLPNPKARTQADVKRDEREFRVRQYIDGYLARGERSAQYDSDVLNFFTNWISSNYGGPMNNNLPSVAAMADKLANNPDCTDPMVQTIAAINCEELHEKNRRLESAVKNFESSRHLGYPRFFATATLAKELINDRDVRTRELDAPTLKYFQEALADGSITPKDQQIIADLLINGWGSSFFTRNANAVCKTVQGQGKDFAWLALVLRGDAEIDAAWKARGGGYANTVTAEGWKGFESHLSAARKYLTQAWKLRPDLPLAPSRMIYVSLGAEGIGGMRLWFDRTVAAQIDYPYAWSEMRWGLRPRWFGDLDSMLAFGNTAINTRRFDTDVPRKFFDSVADVEAEMDLPLGDHIYGRSDVWPHLQEMYEGYVGDPDLSQEERDGWSSSYATVAYLAGKYDVAREQLQKLNWQPHAYNLRGWARDLSLMSLEVAARTGPESEKITAAEAARDTADISGALNIYDGLVHTTNLDARTLAFAQERENSLGLEQQLNSGEWVNFLPTDTNFTGWNISFGDCKLLPDGALEVHANPHGHMLYSRARMGTDFEVRGQFEVASSTTTAFQAGVVMGIPEFQNFNWMAFRMKRNDNEKDVVSVSESWTRRQVSAPASLDGNSNTFYFQLHQGHVTVKINDATLLNDVEIPKNIYVNTNDFHVGLGAFNDSNTTVIRYRNIQLRQATPAPTMLVPSNLPTGSATKENQ